MKQYKLFQLFSFSFLFLFLSAANYSYGQDPFVTTTIDGHTSLSLSLLSDPDFDYIEIYCEKVKYTSELGPDVEGLWDKWVENKSLPFWMIKVDGKNVGMLYLMTFESRTVWEISYFIQKDYRNKGIGFTAVKLLLENISKLNLEVDEILARISPQNKISEKIATKLEAKFVDPELYVPGAKISENLWSLPLENR